ncbi:MAG: hypothetical protein MJZ37_06735 [Bacilli bacterium]|nr:hypothetical protein [Bacilli bacterium]
MSKKNKKPYVNNNYGKCMPEVFQLYSSIKKSVKNEDQAFQFLNEIIQIEEDDPLYSFNIRNFITNLLRDELDGEVFHIYVPKDLVELFKYHYSDNLLEVAKIFMRNYADDMITRKVSYKNGVFKESPIEVNKASEIFIHAEGISSGLVCQIKYEVKADKISLTYFNGYDYSELHEEKISELDLSTKDGKVDKNIWTFVLNTIAFFVVFNTDFKPGLPAGVKADWPSASSRVTLLLPKKFMEIKNKAAS